MQLVFLDRFGNEPEGVEIRFPSARFRRNTWNDYGFETLFQVTLCPEVNRESWQPLGSVKFGYRGYSSSDPSVRSLLTGVIDGLSDEWFSLGQSKSYYQLLEELPLELTNAFAQAVRDIPILHLAREELENEDVYRVSLLRSSGALEALDFAWLSFNGGGDQEFTTSFEFRAAIASTGDHVVPFDFTPRNGLPHRINVLVGVNGVGKTQLMARLAIALGRFEEKDDADAREARGKTFEEAGSLTPRPSFYSVIAMSFSAFDDFAIPKPADIGDLRYAYCGIRRPAGGLLSEKELALRIPRLIKKMDALQTELFRTSVELLLPQLGGELPGRSSYYTALSAGQRIALNIACELILNLQSRSLILLDEPETHLHPQLLTTLLTVINLLLERLDCFAIVATHSPIVVQQVLASRVHVVQRVEPGPPIIQHPPAETFGENLSEIVRLVFDAVESDRDYQNVLDELLDSNDGDPDRVSALFPNGPGLNASLYLDSCRPENLQGRED